MSFNFFSKKVKTVDVDFEKKKEDVKNLENIMRNIEKFVSLYAPHYQAIESINAQFAIYLSQFYDRYPPFKTLSNDVTAVMQVHNEGLKLIQDALKNVQFQFKGWFTNFEHLKQVWKSCESANEEFESAKEKFDKIKQKNVDLRKQTDPKELEKIVKTEKKYSETKEILERNTTESMKVCDKVLSFSYTIVNPVILEILDAQARCFTKTGEMYRILGDLNARNLKSEKAYLAVLQGSLEQNQFDDFNKQSISQEKAEIIQQRTMLFNMNNSSTNNNSGPNPNANFNPFSAYETKYNQLEAVFEKYQNTYSSAFNHQLEGAPQGQIQQREGTVDLL